MLAVLLHTVESEIESLEVAARYDWSSASGPNRPSWHDDSLWLAAGRAVRSKGFIKSRFLTNFLLHICEIHLTGCASKLTEQATSILLRYCFRPATSAQTPHNPNGSHCELIAIPEHCCIIRTHRLILQNIVQDRLKTLRFNQRDKSRMRKRYAINMQALKRVAKPEDIGSLVESLAFDSRRTSAYTMEFDPLQKKT